MVKRKSDRVLRVTAENLNRLLGLPGESLVESRWVKPFAESLLRLKRLQDRSSKALDNVRDSLSAAALDGEAGAALARAQALVSECRHALARRLAELEMFDRRSINLAHRLYDEALACRMRPFADGVQGFPRMVRDLARSLGKQVRLEIVGGATQVDRDILAKLDAPLGHLLRNADRPRHRVTRRAPGRRKACRGRDPARSASQRRRATGDHLGRWPRRRSGQAAPKRRGAEPDDADGRAALSEAELLEFLFLPGFTMKGTVTDVSGRGVGLDVVQDMVKQVRGNVRVSSQPGKGRASSCSCR